MTAELHVLLDGYVRGADAGANHVAGTISLVKAGEQVIVHDPGMCTGPQVILDPLASHDIQPADVTDVILSHHHPDHTRFMGLFPFATVHDYWAIYDGDLWTARPAEGAQVAPGVTLLETPGHTREDITTLVETADGVVALSHLWWFEGMEGDPRATDLDLLQQHRARVLEQAVRIIPGHGPAFDV